MSGRDLHDIVIKINGSETTSNPEGITLQKRELWVGNDGSLWVGSPEDGSLMRIVAGGVGGAITVDSSNSKIIHLNKDAVIKAADGATLESANVTKVKKMTVTNAMYGKELPATGEEGQLFFKLL